MKKLYLLLIGLFLLGIAYAYPLTVTLNGNVPFTTQVYHCTGSGCFTLDAYVTGVSGNPNVYTITSYGGGTQYFAEYDYVTNKCYVPQGYINWFTSSSTSTSYPVIFIKKVCNSSISSFSHSGNAVNFSVASPLKTPVGAPGSIPSAIQEYYSATVRADLEVRNSSNNFVYSNSLSQDILASTSKKYGFNIPITQPGTYNVVVRVYSSDCFCSSNAENIRQYSFSIDGCNQNSDCGSVVYSNNFCSNSSVVRNITNPVCVNPLAPDSYCSTTTGQETVEECEIGCSEGACLSECEIDEDCGDETLIENKCVGREVWSNYSIPACLSGSCELYYDFRLKETCLDECISGECVDITCYNNSDCGIDGFIGNEYCDDEILVKKYRTYTCSNAGTILSSCSHETKDIVVEECEYWCEEGECIGECKNEDIRNCNTGLLGVCAGGIETCSNYFWGSCEQSKQAEDESCDGLDNDCDGVIDNGFDVGEFCSVGIGACYREGAYVCGEEGESECSVIPGAPEDEICNDGIDNDCDWEVDEYCVCEDGDAQDCDTGLLGICSDGIQTCSNNSWGDCLQINESGNEVCDGIDNDCDGEVDEYINCSIECYFDMQCDPWPFECLGNFCFNITTVYQKIRVGECVNPGSYDSYCDIKLEDIFWKNCEENERCVGELPDGHCEELNGCAQDSDCSGGSSELSCSEDILVNESFVPFCSQNGSCGLRYEKTETVCEFGCENDACIRDGFDLYISDGYTSPAILYEDEMNESGGARFKLHNTGDESLIVLCTTYIDGEIYNFSIPFGIGVYDWGVWIGNLIAGNHNLTIIVDANNTYDENNEDNNIFHFEFEILKKQCIINSDCGNESYSLNYCSNGDIVRDHKIPECINYSCSTRIVKEFVDDCHNGCENGECKSGASSYQYCGDDLCNGNEDESNCPQDCKIIKLNSIAKANSIVANKSSVIPLSTYKNKEQGSLLVLYVLLGMILLLLLLITIVALLKR